MRAKWAINCALGLAFSLAGCGYAGPSIPKYAEPTLKPSESAVVECDGGAYITAVDNAEVPGSNVRLGTWGGNKVVLIPGKHRIAVSLETSNGNSYSSRGGSMEHDFRAGHRYKLGRPSIFSGSVQLSDETSGEKWPTK